MPGPMRNLGQNLAGCSGLLVVQYGVAPKRLIPIEPGISNETRISTVVIATCRIGTTCEESQERHHRGTASGLCGLSGPGRWISAPDEEYINRQAGP